MCISLFVGHGSEQQLHACCICEHHSVTHTGGHVVAALARPPAAACNINAMVGCSGCSVIGVIDTG